MRIAHAIATTPSSHPGSAGMEAGPLDGATQGSADRRLAVPPLRSQAFVATAAPAGAGFMVADRATLLAADSPAVAASGVPAALATGAVPTAPRAVLPVAAAHLLLLLLPAAAVAATPAAVAAAPARVLPLPFSSSPRRSGARWAKVSASQQGKPRPPHPRCGHPSRADHRRTHR